MAKLQVTPAGAFTEYRELNFQGLYLHRYYTADANQAGVVSDAKIGIGATVVNNWAVYDGPGTTGAKLVARAQGFHIKAGNWYNSFTIVFVDERFKDSTLEVNGIVVENGEWAIVGGTGQFAMANGVITKKELEATSDKNIVLLTIRAFCPQLKGTRYPVTKIGPWGGNEGSPVDVTEAPRCLESITISSGWVVDSIAFSYIDYCGQKRSAGRWGGPGGAGTHTIQLGESEVVTEVSGTIGKHQGQTVISSIKFVTNLNNAYGPWGEARDNPSPFIVPVQPGSAIVGFFARAGDFINALGVHVRPL